jgi:seryl-tRNA synthetase
MHDIKWIRENGEAFDHAMVNRRLEPMSARLIEIDERRRAHLTKLQEAQARQNAASKDIGKAKAQKDETTAQRLMAEVADLKAFIQSGEATERTIAAELEEALAVIPNVPFDDVPIGEDEHGNVELRKIGTPRQFNYAPKQHFEIGEALGLMDFETASKISGSRFVILKGALARLERALGQFMLDVHTSEHGYTEINPPFLTKAEAMYGTTQLPKFEEDLFRTIHPLETRAIQLQKRIDFLDWRTQKPIHDGTFIEGLSLISQPLKYSQAQLDADLAEKDGWAAELKEIFKELSGSVSRFYLIPTAEVPLTNMVRGEILDEAVLPFRFTALTPSFRSEAGSAGRDTRGMIRVHQFFKTELVSITTPETSDAEHSHMTKCAETILERLGLPFRTIVLCTGDMGFASKKTYDIEVWLPGQNAYREISSCSNCGDFQARRMNARFRPKDAKGTQFVHTLNGSGVAVGRALVAVIENYQEEDGSIVVPEVLRPYMGGLERIG